MALSNIVQVSITANTKTPSQATFSVPLLLAAHNVPGGLVQTFTSAAAVNQAGFDLKSPGYLMAAAVFDQDPAPATVKIGQRTHFPNQHLTLGVTNASVGAYYQVTIDEQTFTYTTPGGGTAGSVATALAALFNAANSQTIYATASGSTVTLQPVNLIQITTGASGSTYYATVNNAVYSYGATAGDTKTTIAAGLETAIAADTTLVAGSTGAFITIRGTTAGTTGPSIQSVSPTTLMSFADNNQLLRVSGWTPNLVFNDVTVDPGVANDLAAVFAADHNWYGAVLDSNSLAEVEAAGAWVLANSQLLFYQQSDTDCMNPVYTTDAFSFFKTDANLRTAGIFSMTNNADYRCAAWVGALYPYQPGSETWVFKTLLGIAADNLSGTQYSALLGKYATVYDTEAGLNVTEGGQVGSGQWIDVVRFLDWLTATIQTSVFTLLVNNVKVPYTDFGGDMIHSVIASVLSQGESIGGLVTGSSSVTVPKVATVPVSYVGQRILPNVTFTSQLAGAIQEVIIQGTVSLS